MLPEYHDNPTIKATVGPYSVVIKLIIRCSILLGYIHCSNVMSENADFIRS